jgi:polyhydroxyalkanoate synthase
METYQWLGARTAALAFHHMDRLRQWRGKVLDACGFAPQESPYRVVHAEAGLRLRRYGDGSQQGPALLIMPAPIKRGYIWDLAPSVSVVRRCLRQGMRVYMAEWTQEDAGPPISHFGLADYADRLPTACIDRIQAETGQEQVVLAGHSLGGTLAAIFSCLYPQRVRGLVLLEAPLCFGPDAGNLCRLVASAPDTSFIERAFDHVPGSFLNLVSVAAAPDEFQWLRMMDRSMCAWNPKALDIHMRVERWTLDEFSLPGRLFREIVEHLYRSDRLMQGRLRIGDGERRIGPRDLDVPLLCVIDPRSSIIPPESVVPFLQAAACRGKKLLSYRGDIGVALQHVGVLVGANAHAHIWPAIFDWLSTTVPHTDVAARIS